MGCVQTPDDHQVHRDFATDEASCIERIKMISAAYTKWLCNEDKSTDIRDMITNGEILSGNKRYNFAALLKDYRAVLELNRDLAVGDDEKEICNAETCLILHRTTADREYIEARRKMYCIDNDNEASDDAVSKSVACQQILDSLHEVLYHTIYLNVGDIDAMFNAKRKNNAAADADDICNAYNDIAAQEICDAITEKRKKSKRFRKEQTTSNKFNKFKTSNQIKADSVENKKIPCFIDAFFNQMRKKGIKIEQIYKIAQFIADAQYDSEPIQFDLKRPDGCNLKQNLKISNKVQEIGRNFAKEFELKQNIYDAGKRFFYWPFYRNNKDQRHLLFANDKGQSLFEENSGYNLCEWFIDKKYANLKEEVLNKFSKEQFDNTTIKATDKLNAWNEDPEVENIRCSRDYWSKTYGIEKGEEITVQHVMCVMFYTNFSKNCYEFSATFRKLHQFETDKEMKQRHREYAIWGRFLREAVECFGTSMGDSDITLFYHGVANTLYFNSTSLHLCGPMSTTIGLFTTYTFYIPFYIFYIFCVFLVFCIQISLLLQIVSLKMD